MSDTPEVRTLCQRLVPGVVPDVLRVETPPGVEPLDCFGNVERMIEAYGGGVQYGWQLWETLPTVMIEAEFHAVWVDTDGDLRDVTPKHPGVTEIVFLPDPNLVYTARQVDNVRVALRDDPLIHEFIENAERYFEATNRGALADFHGDLTPHLTPEIKYLRRRQIELQLRIHEKYYAI